MELISRQDVKDMIKRKPFSLIDERILMNTIDSIPTVEERKEGKWVRITQDVGVRPHQYMCTECHRIIEYSSSESPWSLEMKFPYCHCGAKMKEADHNKECHKPASSYYRAYCAEWQEDAYCDGCEFWY